MRINDVYGRLNDLSVGSSKRGAPAGQSPATEGAGGKSTPATGEKVTLSSEAQKLAAKSAEDAETAKVGKLRAAIKDGSFKVDPQAIAKRLVEGG
jgi:negative regulator of flagellin synthesis FlgM